MSHEYGYSVPWVPPLGSPGRAVGLARRVTRLPFGPVQGLRGRVLPFACRAQFPLGPGEFRVRLTQPPLGRGHLLACPVDRVPGPPGCGVGVLPLRAPVMCLPRGPLRRPLRAGLFLLATSAAPLGEFVPAGPSGGAWGRVGRSRGAGPARPPPEGNSDGGVSEPVRRPPAHCSAAAGSASTASSVDSTSRRAPSDKGAPPRGRGRRPAGTGRSRRCAAVRTTP